MVVPVLDTMRIIDGRPAKENTQTVKSRAFQLTIEEARAALDVVAST